MINALRFGGSERTDAAAGQSRWYAWCEDRRSAENDEERGGDQIARKSQEDHTARPHAWFTAAGPVELSRLSEPGGAVSHPSVSLVIITIKTKS